MFETNPLDDRVTGRELVAQAIWIRATAKLLVSKGVFTKEELIEALWSAEKYFNEQKDREIRRRVKDHAERIEKYWTNAERKR